MISSTTGSATPQPAHLAMPNPYFGFPPESAALLAQHFLPRSVFELTATNMSQGYTDIETTEVYGAYLFCDMSGFTAFSEAHSPAAVMFSMSVFFEEAIDIFQENSGEILRFMGDGFFAFFPDPRAAALASVLMANKFRLLAHSMEGISGAFLKFRTGLHSGKAIRCSFGGRSRKELSFFGDSINVASRLETQCQPGKVLVSSDFVDACEGNLLTSKTFKLALKGKTDTVEVCYLRGLRK
jgi:adenylate cyclase